MDELESERPISPARLSKTPSWITLGFVLGALFVYSLPRHENAPVRSTVAPAAAAPVRLDRPKLMEIEAVFTEWGRYALWADDLTQVALWDTEKQSYSIFYEVLRSGGNFYFRSIPRIDRFVPPEEIRLPAHSPLRFARMLVGDLPAPGFHPGERDFRPMEEVSPPKRKVELSPAAPPMSTVPGAAELPKTRD